MTTENKDIGFIKIYRSIESWDWWSDLNTFRLFIVLLINANWKPRKWKGRHIDRGQLWTSLDSLVEKSGLSKMQVRTSLDKLISTHEITREVTHNGQLIIVVNYDFYQSSDGDITHNSTRELTDEQHTDNTAVTLNNKFNNINNINNTVVGAPDEFDIWKRLTSEEIDSIYASYPNSGGILIDEVAVDVRRKRKKIMHPLAYILEYAKRKRWDDNAEFITDEMFYGGVK